MSVESANDVEWSTVDDTPAAWSALGELYHRFLTGLLLGMVTRVGVEPAAALSSEPSEISTSKRSSRGSKSLASPMNQMQLPCEISRALELSRWSARGVDPESEQSPGCGTCHRDGFSTEQRCAEFQQS